MTNRCVACGLDVYDGGELCPLCHKDERQNGPRRMPAGGRGSTTENKGKDVSRLQIAAERAISRYGSMRAAAKALGTNHGVISMALDGIETDAGYKALGVRKTDDHVVAFHLDEQTANELRALLARYGTRRRIARALVTGELKIVENGGCDE